MQQESKSAILFRHWLRANPQLSGSYEMKDSGGKDRIPFSAVEKSQLEYGMAIKSDKGVFIRVTAIQGGEPDYVYLRNSPAYIVIKYPKSFQIIDVETFVLEKERSKTKSLTEDRAKDIAIKSIKLKNENKN